MGVSVSRSVPRTSVYMTQEQTDRLRELARRLGYRQTRGVGTGEAGSVTALLVALAAAYGVAPAAMTEALRTVLADTGERPHD